MKPEVQEEPEALMDVEWDYEDNVRGIFEVDPIHGIRYSESNFEALTE